MDAGGVLLFVRVERLLRRLGLAGKPVNPLPCCMRATSLVTSCRRSEMVGRFCWAKCAVAVVRNGICI